MNIMKDIILEIRKRAKDIGSYADLPGRPVKLDKDNFHNITGPESEAKVVFIDGGNNEIASSADFSLHFVRVYASIYRKNKRISAKKFEFFCLAVGKVVKTYPVNGFNPGSIEMKDAAYSADDVMKQAEIEVGRKICSKLHKGDIIVRDGDLQDCERLINAADQKGVVLCGLAKTTRLVTDTGYSLVAALNRISPSGEWIYYPLAESQNTSVVKLNRHSRHSFKLETNKMEELARITGMLKENSRDAVFLGYPYGLIEADRFARVSDAETKILRIKFENSAGRNWKEIENSIHSIDAHHILDNIS